MCISFKTQGLRYHRLFSPLVVVLPLRIALPIFLYTRLRRRKHRGRNYWMILSCWVRVKSTTVVFDMFESGILCPLN
jgi:hypothetical protein